MRFLGWYIAALLAAYSLSASWSLGMAADRVAVLERQDRQFAEDLNVSRSRLAVVTQRVECTVHPEACFNESGS